MDNYSMNNIVNLLNAYDEAVEKEDEELVARISNVLPDDIRMKWTVFFADGSVKRYLCLEDVVRSLADTEFTQVTLYDYVFSKNMYLRQDVTKRIRCILADNPT